MVDGSICVKKGTKMSLKLKLLYVCCFALLAANVALIVVNWNYTKWAHTHDETPDVCLRRQREQKVEGWV